MRALESGSSRGLGTIGSAAVALLFLAGCNATDFAFTGPPTIPAASPVTGEVLGTGTVRVALIIPLSANGGAGQAARDLRNAAMMALQELTAANIQILVKDDRGTPEGARAAAAEAISQGAELILGPLVSASVAAAAEVARPAGIPIIAFASDPSVAGPGVYLMGLSPRSDVLRIVPYAARAGFNSIAALLPDNGYGTLAEAALRESVAAAGARIVVIQRYALDRGAMQVAAEAVADILLAGQADAVFMPDAGDVVPFMAQIIAAKGVPPGAIKFLGGSQWNDARTRSESTLTGGWFSSPPDQGGITAFAARFATAFGTPPLPIAALGYDAVRLAAGLAASFGPARFVAATITNPSGFLGIDGAFRFLANGTNERTLAIYEIERGGTQRLIDPAPTGFAVTAATLRLF